MNKKLLGTVLALAVIIAVAAVTPTLAHNPCTPSASGVLHSYGYSGDVIIQLPSPSTPSHPYNLRIVATHFDARSANGVEDYITVHVWAPNYQKGSFVAVACVSDAQAGVDFVKAMYTGAPFAQNTIKVADDELEMWKEGDILTVNLTKAIDIKIGNPFPQALKDLNFTLQPMTLEFRGFDEVFKDEGAPSTIPPSLSGAGWTQQVTHWRQPAWVRVSIPAWIGSVVMPTVGTFNKKTVMTYTPPAP